MNTLHAFFHQPYNWKNLGVLALIAFLIRGLVFFSYIQHNERYHQADSMDYHACGIGIALGQGMFHINQKKPIFWRTPGYPAYLAPFYKCIGITDFSFQANSTAQKASIWLQIILCSFIPIVVFFLSLSLTSSLMIAWIASWIFVFHLGFILASCYLLTDALATLFFYFFLLFFYVQFSFIGEPKKSSNNLFLYTILAILSLSVYTWMRPNGEFIALMALIVLLFCAASWKKKLIKIVLFGSIFFISISPWYVRNYNLTGKWFFCPMSGPYHLAFTAPKIIRRLSGQNLEICIKYLFAQIKPALKKQEDLIKLTHPEYYISQELICKDIAMPWIKKYPHYVFIDWLREVCKTTFDLYSSQLVAFANNSFTYDPLEEFLSEKLKNCIYKQSMPILMRTICLLELLFSLLVWFGLIGGFIKFIVLSIIKTFRKKEPLSATTYLWLKTGLMIGGLLFMTGGFGYARLRMPVEVLMIILSLTFWLWLLQLPKKEIIQ